MIRPAMVLLLAGVLAGCGGGGGNKGTTTTTAPAASSTTVPHAVYKFPPTLLPENTNDVNNAASISLTQNDFPRGWQRAQPTGSRSPRPAMEDEVLVNCLFGENPSGLTGYVVSDVYVPAEFNLQVRSFVRVTSSKANASNDFKNFTIPRIQSCQDSMYDWEQNPPAGVENPIGRKFGNAVPIAMPVDKLPLSDSTTDSLGFRMIITPTDATAVHQDIFAYGAGRYETVMIVQSLAVPDINQETDVFKRVKARALAAAKLG
jgi:hypothetical protein